MSLKSKKIATVILAAGKGTRMNSPLPKILHKVAGKPLVDYVIDVAKSQSSLETIIVLSPNMGDVYDRVISLMPSVREVVQSEQLGTAHAVLQSKKYLEGFDGIVFILYADTPFINQDTLGKMYDLLVADSDSAVAILGFDAVDPKQYGRLVKGDKGNLREIIEYKDASDEQREITLCNSGVMAIKGDILFELLEKIDNSNAKNEYYLTDIVALARGMGRNCPIVVCDENEVMGINSQAELAMAEKIMQDKLRLLAMENGGTMIAPETVFLSADTKFGKGVVIHPNVVFGNGVAIADNVEIKSFSHIEGATIGDNAVIGPFARIRPNAIIGENAKIGNFVEIKKSDIGKGAKVSHLTYIGDSMVGDGANIGAGTVTCNYDGYNKSRTEIGEGAFIGSNTSLVAPVKIGDNAIIGAGSTILSDVEDNAVAINNMPQRNVANRAEEIKKTWQEV